MKAKWEIKAKYYKVPARRTPPPQITRFTVGGPDVEGFQTVLIKRKALADITNRVSNTLAAKRGPRRPTKLSVLEQGQKPILAPARGFVIEPIAPATTRDINIGVEIQPPAT